MLILNRYPGQSILIGDDITITVIKSDRGQVTIGIDAPRDIAVDREEIRERKLESITNFDFGE